MIHSFFKRMMAVLILTWMLCAVLPTLSENLQAESSDSDWALMLINRSNPIPDDYQVGDLVELRGGQKVDRRIYPDLQAMFDAARADGVYPIVGSGFRTTEKQQQLMDDKIAAYRAEGHSEEEARRLAESWVAIPGASEHQIGICADINAADGSGSTNEEVYAWLREHAHRFGFILRYPEDKTDITGTIYEPWHYRYVGISAATEIYNGNLCLEEYLSGE